MDNSKKQSKSSIVMQTCWMAGWKGATIDEITMALDDAGFYLNVEKRIVPMLKTLLRKKQLKKYKNKWIVEQPPDQRPNSGL